jgi:hypothetical protein
MTDPTHRRPARNRSRAYAAVILFYLILFFAVMWPVYPRFSSIEPRVLAMPFSLAYVVGVLVLSFSVLLGLYLWEGGGRHDALTGDDEAGR